MSADKKIQEIKQFCETGKNWCFVASVIGLMLVFSSVNTSIGAALTSVSLGFFMAIAIVRSMIGWPNIEEKE